MLRSPITLVICTISLSQFFFLPFRNSKGIEERAYSMRESYRPNTVVQANKEIQLQDLCDQLSKLLKEKKFSAFALHMKRGLAQFPKNAKLLELKKQYVIADYQNSILNQNSLSIDKYFDKKPSFSSCQPGVVNALGNQFVLNRINYVRRLAGIYDSCILDPALNRKCQMASLMMDANGMLDHSPKSNWKCYSREGASAAGTSNLSLGNTFAEAIMGQMEDDGSGNSACGHRRWILNPYNSVFGHGSTYNSMTLSVFGSGDSKLAKNTRFADSQFVCWPAADFFPLDLVPERWNFSLANADFTKAKITVTADGKPVKVKIEPIKTGYALNSIVWTIGQQVKAGSTYVVNISQVKLVSGWGRNAKVKMKSYTYQFVPLATN